MKWQEGRQPRRLLCFSAAFFMMALVFSLLFSRGGDLMQVFLLTGACACGLAAVTLFLLRENFPLFLSLLGGLFVGLLWCGGYALFIWQPTQAYDGVVAEVRLELTEYAQSKESYGVAHGIVTQVDGKSCRMKVKAFLTDGSPNYAPGDVLVFEGQLNAARRDWKQNLLQEGIFLTLSQESDQTVNPGAAVTLPRQARVLSRRITQRVEELLPGDEGALLAALLSGERDGFSPEMNRALTISGTRHITAVSGLHISILAGILMGLLGKKWGLLVSVPAAVAYATIVGFSPSVVRAAVLLIFWATAFWLKLERDSLTAFAAALLLLLLWNPFSCLSVGLLLSFGATLGLILLSPTLNGVMTQKIKNIRSKPLKAVLWYVAGTITATLAATLFTLPLNILFFDSVPLLNLLSNLLILWALSLTMTLGLICLALSLFLPWTAGFLARWVLRWPLLWMIWVIKWIGGLSFAATDANNLLLLIACLGLIVAALLWRGKQLSGKGLLLAAMVLICITGIFTAGERMLCGVVEIENVGGQPVILLRNEGISLINSGARAQLAAESVESALSRWNGPALETILCTTGNYKSQSGLTAVLDRTEAQRVLLPSASGEVAAALSGQPIVTYAKTGTVTVSGTALQLLAGGDDTFALRLLAKRFSLLCLCGLKPASALAVTEENLCDADILLVDDSIASDWQLLYSICNRVSPRQILITTNGYSEHGERFSGIPVTLIPQDGVQFRFMR